MSGVAQHLKRHVKRFMRLTQKQLLPPIEETPMTQVAFRNLSSRYRLSDFLTYRYADEKGLSLADNPNGLDSRLIGFEIFPLIMAGENAEKNVESLLGLLPEGSIVHSIAYAHTGFNTHLAQWAAARRQSQNPLIDKLTLNRVAYFRQWGKHYEKRIQGELFAPRLIDYYWFIRLPNTLELDQTDQLASFNHEIEELTKRVSASLRAARLGCRVLTGLEIAHVCRELLNPQSTHENLSEIPLLPEEPINSQLLSSYHHLVIGRQGELIFSDLQRDVKKYARVLTVKHPPRQPHYLYQMGTCIGSIDNWQGYIPGDFIAFSIIEVLSRDKTQRKIMKKIGFLHNTRRNSSFWQSFLRHKFEEKANLQLVYNEMSQEGRLPVKVISGIVVTGNTSEKVEEAMRVAMSQWQRSYFELAQETAIALPMFLASLPGQFRPEMDDDEDGLQRGMTMRALNAATLTHVQGDWPGSHPKRGGLLAMSRRGGLTCLNIFDTYKSNYNGIIAATSGAGKSFFVNEMATDFLGRGGIVRIVDAGRSYYNTTEVLKGQNLVFERGKGICINPFSDIVTKEMLVESMECLTTLVTQMAYPFGFGQQEQAGFEKPFEYRTIEKAIEMTWEEKQSEMSIRDIYQWVLKQNDPRIRDIAVQLHPWSEGRYAPWLIGKSNVAFDNPMIVLELDELASEPELQTVVLNLVLTKISQEMYRSTQAEVAQYGEMRPKLVVIDEAWDLLTRPNTAGFIEKTYRRARKYLGSIWLVTQSFKDCAKTSAARAALDNANWVIALMQNVSALQQAIQEKLIPVSEMTAQLIRDLQKTDDYAEFYAINQSAKGEGLYRLIVDPLSYFLYTTEGKEKAALTQLTSQGYSLEEAIEKLAKQQMQKWE
jgi:conjugal transfer ATP-binding protein TraC